MNINGYILKSELKNANSGFSKWGFATKNGKEYFIKELINPVFPVDKSIMSEEVFQQRKRNCYEYEEKTRRFFELINRASRGNLVRIDDFFRHGSRYYLVSEKIEGESPSMEYIATLDEEKKLLLLKSVAQCFSDLHSVGIVHSDVKSNNILIKTTKSGNYVAKLIDFDSGFMKGEPIDNEELGGELAYLAPETFLRIYGQDVIPDEKSDIFSLGLMFHEYYCGHLPYYDKNEYEYPYESVLDGKGLMLETSAIPKDISSLIAAMLDEDPEKRPSAKEIVKKLNAISGKEERDEIIKEIVIWYGGAYGKTISVRVDAIEYRNVVHPSVRSEMESQKECYPDNYLANNCRPIANKSVYEAIAGQLAECGMWNLVKESKDKTCEGDGICQKIDVICENGAVYSYSTEGASDPTFTKIVSVLSSYCTFPEKRAYINGDVGGGDVNTQTQSKDSWFTRAGDL